MESRRETLLDAARDVEATAAEIARALPTLLGRELSANTLRTWARIGALDKRQPDEHSRLAVPRRRRHRPRARHPWARVQG